MRCFVAFSLSLLAAASSNAIADELPSVETLFREAHENVSRIDSLEYESVTETPGSNGRMWAIRQAHFQKDRRNYRMDLMDNGPAVKRQKFNKVGLLNEHSAYSIFLEVTPIHVTERQAPGPEFSHDLWWNTYRWVGDASARANYAAHLRSIADEVESGKTTQSEARSLAAAPYRQHLNDFKNWNTWEQQIPHSKVLREESLLKQKAYVVEVSPPKNSSFEVWFVRSPACLPVRIVTQDQNDEAKVQFTVQDLITLQMNRGAVTLPSKVETSLGIEHLVENTLRVNQEIPKNRFQIDTLARNGPLHFSEHSKF